MLIHELLVCYQYFLMFLWPSCAKKLYLYQDLVCVPRNLSKIKINLSKLHNSCSWSTLLLWCTFLKKIKKPVAVPGATLYASINTDTDLCAEQYRSVFTIESQVQHLDNSVDVHHSVLSLPCSLMSNISKLQHLPASSLQVSQNQCGIKGK